LISLPGPWNYVALLESCRCLNHCSSISNTQTMVP
jgi:hypothetical protein